MNKGLLFLLIMLSTVVIYALYFWASSQTKSVQGFNRTSKEGIEFFKLRDRHIGHFKNAIVTLNQMEGGAPLIKPQVVGFLFPGRLSLQDGIIITSKRHERMYALQVILQNAELNPGNYEFENPLFNQRISEDLAPLYFNQLVAFKFTEEHSKLVRRLNVQWQNYLLALGIDPKRPYGDATAFEFDMADILNIEYNLGSQNDLSQADHVVLKRLVKLHDEMVPAMQALLRFGMVSAGWYYRLGEFEPWQPVTDAEFLRSSNIE